MKSYIIHLVRHGMTVSNIEGRFAGTTDVALSEKGINNLRELKDKYDYENPEIIFSSPLTRCIDTAKTLYGEDKEIRIVNDLHEINLGDFEGQLADDLVNDPQYIEWARSGMAPPNGESNNDFAKRVCTAFVRTIRDILKSGKTNTAICTHGGVIMMLLSVYGIPERESIDWLCNNGRGYTIRVTPSIWMRTGMVEVLSEYPFGSNEEPTLAKNPAKENGFSVTTGIDNLEKPTPIDELDEDYYDDEYADTDDTQSQVIWADIDEQSDKTEQ